MTLRPGVALAWGVAVAGGVVCSWRVAAGGPVLHARWSLLVVLGLWAVAWAVAVVTTMRMPTRGAVVLVVLAAVALRAAALAGTPNT
ncbi:MAG: hypothetical protein JO265_03095, partial [Acidimicrobiia bacterium]|nr:hypothetical protein [Acidimicrobiia bacterium]